VAVAACRPTVAHEEERAEALITLQAAHLRDGVVHRPDDGEARRASVPTSDSKFSVLGPAAGRPR
jgi:hypothetical protein